MVVDVGLMLAVEELTNIHSYFSLHLFEGGGACVTGQLSLLLSHKQGNKTQVKIYDFYTNLTYPHIYTEFQLSTF